jgi:hypothetical protein
MSALGWGILLGVLKWGLIALVYAVLILFLFSLRREMSLHIGGGQPKAELATGKMRVVNPGGDARLAVGAVLYLKSDSHLGAARDNDILLKDPFISGHHARLTWDGAAWWIEDLGSRNGTFVSGQPCPARTPQPVHFGARLQVGDIIFELMETN